MVSGAVALADGSANDPWQHRCCSWAAARRQCIPGQEGLHYAVLPPKLYAMTYLTERQKEILEFVHEYRRERGIAPTHREICARFGYSSFGTVYKHLKLLQDKGFLRRDWNQKRGIELIRAIPGLEP